MHYVPSINLETVDFVGRFFNMIEGARTARAQRSAFNSTYKELSRLTNAELADIGLRRDDIADVARRGAVEL